MCSTREILSGVKKEIPAIVIKIVTDKIKSEEPRLMCTFEFDIMR